MTRSLKKEGFIVKFPFEVLEIKYGMKESNLPNLPEFVPYAGIKVKGNPFVKELEFYGNISGLEKGDFIEAEIHQYKSGMEHIDCPPEGDYIQVYYNKEPDSKEVVCKINKLEKSASGQVYPASVLASFEGFSHFISK